MHLSAAASAAFAFHLAFAPPAAANGLPEAPPLIDTIALWLAANFDLALSTEAPELVGVPEGDLVEMRYGTGSTVAAGDVVAVYDDASGTIYLAEDWTGQSPAELSVLVHEMVHHLQAEADMRFACPAEREKLAYRAQDAWLGLFGESLENAFGIDAATLLVGTMCAY